MAKVCCDVYVLDVIMTICVSDRGICITYMWIDVLTTCLSSYLLSESLLFSCLTFL